MQRGHSDIPNHGGIRYHFAFFEGFDLPEPLRAIAWRTSALNADSSTSSPGVRFHQTRVEETGWILQSRALGGSKLHDLRATDASFCWRATLNMSYACGNVDC
jgi:hypothetical protein